MSPERTYGVLFAALVLVALHNVLALDCYVCSSLENPSCSSDLEDIGTITCGSSTTSSTTTVDGSTSTGSSMSTASSTQAGESSSSQSSTSTTGSSTDSSITSDSTESEVTIDTSESSETSSDTTTETSSSSDTEQSTTEDTDSASEDTSASDTTANTESDSSSTDETTISLFKSDPDGRLLHNLVERDITRMLSPKNSEDYVCYKIVYTKNNTSVTERGCYAGTSSTTCTALNEDINPDCWNECTTCREDGCNSTSTIQLSMSTFFLLLVTVFVLIR